MSARDLSYSTYLAMVISGLWIRVAYASTWKHRVLVTLSPTIFQGSGRAGDIQFSQNEAIYLGEFLCAREYINNVLHRIPLASQSLFFFRRHFGRSLPGTLFHFYQNIRRSALHRAGS